MMKKTGSPRVSVTSSAQTNGNRLIRIGAGLGLGLGGLLVPASGQGYFPSANPFTPSTNPLLQAQSQSYQTGLGLREMQLGTKDVPQQSDYEIKLGPVEANFTAGTTFMYQSNYNLVSSGSGVAPQDNFTLGPTVGISLKYDISETARLTLGTGVSYQWSLNQVAYNQLTISPSSALNYQFSIGEVEFTVSDNLSTSNQAISNPTISGTGPTSMMNFNRLYNSAGLSAQWQPLRDTTLFSSYAYNINTGLSGDNYGQFDSATQLLTLAVQQAISPVVAVGISGQGNLNRYDSLPLSVNQGGAPVRESARIQNNNTGWNVGPFARWQVSKAISLNGGVSYSAQNYEQDGLVGDTSNFSGITANLGVNHAINQFVSHSLAGGRSVNPGNGSNFTDTYFANYSLNWALTKRSGLNFGFQFNQFEQSGGGFVYIPYDPLNPPPNYLYITPSGIAVVPVSTAQIGQQYIASLGTTLSITKNLSGGITYSYVAKQLNQELSVNTGSGAVPFGNYQTHMVVLSLAYQF